MTAFRASYADWKVIKTRACVQVVLEVPIEQADAAYQVLGGMPLASKEVWCGVARLDPEKAESTPPRLAPVVAVAALPDGVDKDRRRFDTLPYAQQAALRCNDPIYRAFLREMCSQQAAYALHAKTPDSAAVALRDLCEVESRADIRPGTEAEKKWLELERWFAAWQTKERAMA